MWAAEKGNKIIVKLLFETVGVDVDLKGQYGQTPLWQVLLNGRSAIVQLLQANASLLFLNVLALAYFLFEHNYIFFTYVLFPYQLNKRYSFLVRY